MNYYTICPTCGYKLLKAGEGSNIEIFCPKCHEKMAIEITGDKVIIQRVLSDKSHEST
jgi:phage FluMu protein Com